MQMEAVLLVLCGVLLTIFVLLAVKNITLQKSIKEIGEQLTDFLSVDTNAVITTSSRDRRVRKLAETLNQQLRIYQAERQKYQQGDVELKNAVTNISHDLRTPLTAIFGYLELLKQESGYENRRYLELIENRAQVMKQLTEELFRYSVILAAEESGKVENERECLSLNEVIEESIACYYAAFKEAGITPEIILPEKKVKRELSRSALSRIFGNIISNALKYSDGDFSVTMEASGEIIFSNRAAGLNPVTTGRLFDRFFTVETGKSSTGLGLSIAKTLMEQMGGEIHAEYEDGRVQIWLTFPQR